MLLSSLSYICWQFNVLKHTIASLQFIVKRWANVAQVHSSNQLAALKPKSRA